MGAPYQSQTASGFNSSPPADDGTVSAANKVKWSTILGQIGTPLNGVIAAVNTALRAALNISPTSQSSAYTTTTADHLRPIEVTGTTTISLGDAATMVADSMGYEVTIVNRGVATVTVSRVTGANTLNGAAKDIKLAPGQSVVCAVNSTSDGYNVRAVANGVLFDPTDPSKQARFDVSGVTAGQQRVITVPDYNVTLGNIPAGVIMDYAGSSVPTGWLECDGSAVSRATYANLFTAISTTWGSGDGSSTFNLPDFRGRARIGKGTGTLTASGSNADVDTTNDTLTVASNSSTWITGMAVTFTLASGTITGLVSGNTYYVIRASSTTVKLASSLANAQNGTAIDFTAKSSPVWTITHSLTARTLAEKGGEESHAMSSTELLAHTHSIEKANDGAGSSQYLSGGGSNSATVATLSTGGNAAMNNMQPFAATMAIIKY